jgi:hypothetical protein
MKIPDASGWFKPLWARVLVTAFVAAWCAWEWLVSQDQFWGILTLAMLGWAIYTFFFSPGKGEGGPKA